MTTADTLIKVQEPVFYHREYASDFSNKVSDPFYSGWQHYAKRIAVIALPFLTLNKTFSFPVTLAMGGLRTVTSASGLYELAMQDQHPSKRQIALQAINTGVAVIALGGTIFAHPVGMLITTGHDLIGQIYILANQLAFSYYIDFENVTNIFSNLVYLALFLHGGVELAIVALLLQTLMCCYKAYAELDEASEEEPERYLEFAAHLAMAVVRANQTAGQIQILQLQWQLDALSQHKQPNGSGVLDGLPPPPEPTKEAAQNSDPVKESIDEYHRLYALAKDTGNQALMDVLLKYQVSGYTANFMPSLHQAIEAGDFPAVKILVDSGANVNLGSVGPWFDPMTHAVFSENRQIMEYIYAHGAKAHSEHIYRACMSNCLEGLNFLLSIGTPLPEASSDLLYYVLLYDCLSTEIAKRLVLAGVRIEQRHLDEAEIRKDAELLKWLQEHYKKN